MSKLEDIKQVIAEQLCVSESDIGIDSNLVEDFGADSLDEVELLMAFEELYEIDIPDEEAESVSTVEDIVKLIESKGK